MAVNLYVGAGNYVGQAARVPQRAKFWKAPKIYKDYRRPNFIESLSPAMQTRCHGRFVNRANYNLNPNFELGEQKWQEG